jgi:hypothetical protein
MIAENFWESVELKQATDENRIPRFEPGYSEVSKYRAVAPETVSTAPASSDLPLSFYLGPHTRVTLRGVAGQHHHPSSSSS